jgi:penicillin-binding protein 1A
MVVRIGAVTATLTPADWIWTQHTRATELAKVGDVVYVKVESGAGTENPHLLLEQDSGAQASMMAMDNMNGEVLAMVGGRDFALSQFNRATQSQRQTGSSFKPYVYTAAMEAGMKPGDIVVDGPASFYTPNGPYTPHNYEADWRGPMTLTEAFAESRNIPALKLADKVGIKKVIEVARRFGVTSPLPAFLPVAIGAAGVTLEEQVASYSVFPNDGIRIAPHYIRRVTQTDGLPIQQTTPEVKEVISLDIARMMMVLLEAVVQHGTGAAASSLKHAFGGKTGTTNGFTDAWFLGFSPSVTCGTWIGFDNPSQSLGDKETGAKAALPIWMDFMKVAVADKPNEQFARPNAPKRTIAVPQQPDDAVPAAKPSDDDPGDEAGPDITAPRAVPEAAMPADTAMPKPAPIVRRAPPEAAPLVIHRPPAQGRPVVPPR